MAASAQKSSLGKSRLEHASVALLIATFGILPPAHAAGILTQGSNAAIAPATVSIAATLAAEQQGSMVAVQAQNQLSRITNALQSMQNMQTAARNLALSRPGSVPDGLQQGGLVPDPVTPWVGAQTPTQAIASGNTSVTINQTAAQALLSWNSFNVSKNTTVIFNQQGNTNWTALNKIAANGLPSQILGAIKASGHVYLINPNGIIFGGASQINVGSLVASSADLSASQFFANGIFSPVVGSGASAVYTPSFTNAQGSIVVEPGARITTNAPADVTTGGGIVLLLGTQVQNGGAITTEDGQTQLVAGDNFLLRPGYSTTDNLSSTTRGNEVAVVLNTPGSSLQPGGSGLVQNTGIITAHTGDITLAGETVVQDGVALATTSVATRGTIHLLSSASDAFSSVTLGSNGTTLVEPELSSTDTALDSQRAALIADSAAADTQRGAAVTQQFNNLSLLGDQQEDGRIEIVTGGVAHFAAGSDSSVPGGQIAVSATQRVQADAGALLDVSGSYGVVMAMASNDIAVNIQNNELRDDPQNRLTQNLRNNTVYVDARTLSLVPASAADASDRSYTAGGLLEVSGYVANVGHTIGEYSAIGGSIDLSTSSAGGIVAQTGSSFDIDGGSLQYQGGELQQSYLLGSDGRIYNVNNAPADITYSGIYQGFLATHPTWGITQNYANVLNAPSQIYQAGYTVGRAAGSLTLSSPTTLFDGAIQASTVNGPGQTSADPASVTDPYQLTQTQIAEPGNLIIEALSAAAVSAANSNVTFNAVGPVSLGTGDAIPQDVTGNTVLDAAALDKSILGGLQILTNNSIGVLAPLSLAPGGQVSLYGSSVNIAANISVAGGTVSAGQVTTIGGSLATLRLQTGKARDATGDTVVGPGVTIRTAGLWTNLTTNPQISFTQAFINGGPVTLNSVNNLILGAGSAIDTSSGSSVGATGAVTGGAGGAITLGAGNVTFAAATTSTDAPNPKGILTLGGTLDATGVTAGGALTLGAYSFLITDATPKMLNHKIVVLDPAFFTQGFSAYNLVSTGDITVAKGTVVNVTEPTYQTSSASALLPTGTPAAAVFTVALAPLYAPNSNYTAITQRPGASFSAEIVARTSQADASPINKIRLKIANNAEINVDPGQSIDLTADGQISIYGKLKAPGGSISVISDFNSFAALVGGPGTVSVWLGAHAVLDAAAQSVSFTNAAGERIAAAPAGGTITLGSDTSAASVIIRSGAAIEASGSAASDRIVASALAATTSAQPAGVAIPVQGAGGSISLASEEGIYNDGSLLAAAGGADAAGGSLSITLEADQVVNGKQEATPRIMTITQTAPGALLPADLKPGASTGLTIGTASISAKAINQGKFGSVTLFARDAFLFNGNVTLDAKQSISLEEGVIADTSTQGSVTLNAPYVTLSGQTDDTNVATGVAYAAITGFSSQAANGAFSVNAATIDIANAVRFGGILPAVGTVPATDLAGFGTVNLKSSGDLQFEPPVANAKAVTDLITTADLNLTVREIYATGLNSGGLDNGVADAATAALVIAGYNPAASGKNGSFSRNGVLNIEAAPGTTASAPDVILGSLTFVAPTINQGGVIWQPLGSVTFGDIVSDTKLGFAITGDAQAAVNFLPGSITSVSAAGLNVPFGGTTDGVNYAVIGLPVQLAATASAQAVDEYGLLAASNGSGTAAGTGTIAVAALSTDIETGAKVGLAGGGTLTGAGFISGEGGSVNVLTTPLLKVGTSGVIQPALSANPVYAIVAGQQPVQAMAYTQSGAAGSTPALGAQIIIPAGVPGLPAGTYTLLPAAYALEPGGYRVEFDGAAALAAASVTTLANGSYEVAGFSGLADTHERSTLATDFTITPAATVLNYSQYDQEGYSAFLQAAAVTAGTVRPILPIDAGTLVLNLPALSAATLINNGQVSLSAAPGGIGGTLQISGARLETAAPSLDIYGAAPVAGLPDGVVSLSAAQIDAFKPFDLELGVAGGGAQSFVQGVTLENGASLKAARVVITALSGGITLHPGSTINTIGNGAVPADSTTYGLLSNQGASVLDVANGYVAYAASPVQSPDYGPVTVNSGATIGTSGSIAVSTSAAVTIGEAASFGGKYLDLAVPEINIGNLQTLSTANAPAGLVLTQAVLQTLTAGDPASGVPALQILDLTAFDSLNLYGNTSLDLSGGNVQLEINTPAIYGFGGANAVATISAGTLVWNGIPAIAADGSSIVSSLPGGTVTNGPGSGKGTMDLNAQTIILGYSALDVPVRGVTLTRLAAGFSTVNLNATTEITANNAGGLAVYQKIPVYDQAGTGGTLNLNTPLLTANSGATIGFTAGGALAVASVKGIADATGLAQEAAGGEIDLSANSLSIGSSIILPSGKLDLQAQNDIALNAGSRLSLAAVTTTNVDQTVYGFGGDLIMASASGNITQNAGSIIDVSAVDNSAGSINVTATGAGAGQVVLNGTMLGQASGALDGSAASGSFVIQAQSLGDFAVLNANLDAGGFFRTRSFDIRQGDLQIGDGVQANTVSVSVDNGSLSVTGRIDASGNGGGSIRLAASGNLTLAASAVLDGHGTVLQTDSYGVPIDSENAPAVSLTTSTGALTLGEGATIDLASADGVARGDLELNAPRIGAAAPSFTDSQTIADPVDGNLTITMAGPANAQSNGVAIAAAGRLDITGASSLALNGFATYANAPIDPNDTKGQIVDQGYLDLINQDSQVFANGAYANAALAASITGLTAYGAAFHLRPGVQIEGAAQDGDLAVNGDLNLAGYRYGPNVIAAHYGSGEPGVLEIRAASNLNIYGSITDGFAPPPSDAGTEFANGWVVYGSEPLSKSQTLPKPIGISQGSTFPVGSTVNFAVKVTGGSFAAGSVAPAVLTIASAATASVAFVATSAITAPDGNVLYAKGSFVPAGSVIPKGATIAAGGSLPFAVSIGPVTWPANTPFSVTSPESSTVVAVDGNPILPAGALIPAGSALIFQAGDAGLKNSANGQYVQTRIDAKGGPGQGQLYGLATQLPQGDLSWSIGLVSGADTLAANPDMTRSASDLAANQVRGDITLADTHYGIKGTTIVPAFSVIRTGTGSLSLLAGGSINEASSFGIYTAGAQSAAISGDGQTLTDASQSPYNLPQGEALAGSVLGPKNTVLLAPLIANYAAYYPTGGGNVLVAAQGDLNGFISTSGPSDSNAVGAWLWRQGGAGQLAAWWIEYGSLNLVGAGSAGGASKSAVVQFTGFQGVGTLGGGNLNVTAGGNASGLDLVVASSGRVLADGTLLQTGGGDMQVAIGGAINFVQPGSTQTIAGDAGGVISDLRGDSAIDAGSIGTIAPQYGILNGRDFRFLSPLASESAVLANGIDLLPGDGKVSIDARGDLVINGTGNPGTVQNVMNATPVDFAADGITTASGGLTDFSLWSPATGIGLFSAGGDVAPAETTAGISTENSSADNFYPPSLSAISQNGNIYFGVTTAQNVPRVELAPAPDGQLELLAAGSIIGGDSSIEGGALSATVGISGAALATVATAFDPGIAVFGPGGIKLYDNRDSNGPGLLLDFGSDAPSDALHAGDTQPARVYAATGDILNIQFGLYIPATLQTQQTLIAAKPFEIYAGRDIVDSGTVSSSATNSTDMPDIFLNVSGTDLTSITAGRDIIESSFDIAGPGNLVVQAGRNYEALAQGVIDSIGPVFAVDQSNRNSGAGIALIAGSGSLGPDYTGFADAFLNPASALGLTNASDIIAASNTALYTWLQSVYGYTGTAAGAYGYFQTLSAGAQDVFLRQLYFQELNASGLEFNDPGSVRYKSYLLGKTAIAALFPSTDASDQPITYDGNITMSGLSGVHTDFGGAIQTLTPGGETIVGVEGTTPPASAGIITQGSGDIDMYALGSVELGESRVLTTFGGNIVIWSAQGDINAGRGSKTTIDYTPLQRVYDSYGDVSLSPTVPSSGAGIATLNPIPSVAAGNINLVAPLGTVDAGEAGIRVSGNLNVAALHVLNSANFDVQGASTGVPTAVAPNVGALTSTGNAAGAAAQAAENSTAKPQATQLPSVWIVEILGYGSDNGGTQPPEAPQKKRQRSI